MLEAQAGVDRAEVPHHVELELPGRVVMAGVGINAPSTGEGRIELQPGGLKLPAGLDFRLGPGSG